MSDIIAKAHFYALGEKLLKAEIARTEGPMNTISFNCDFPAVSKARPRLGRSGRTYTPKATSDFERAVAWQAKAAMANQPPMTTPCRVEIYALFTPPKSWPKWKQAAALGKPYNDQRDVDNQIKAICDAMNEVVYIDDRKIAHVAMERYYGRMDTFRVTVFPLDGVPQTKAEVT